MKTLMSLCLLLGLVVGTPGHAEKSFEMFLKNYITHGGCRVYADQQDLDLKTPGIQNFEVWLFLNSEPTNYDANRDQRAVLLLEDQAESRMLCRALREAKNLKTKVTFEVDPAAFFTEPSPEKVIRVLRVVDDLNRQLLPVIENFSAPQLRINPAGFSPRIQSILADKRQTELQIDSSELNYSQVLFFAGMGEFKGANAKDEWARANQICQLLGFSEARNYTARTAFKTYTDDSVKMPLLRLIDLTKLTSQNTILETVSDFDNSRETVRLFIQLECRGR